MALDMDPQRFPGVNDNRSDFQLVGKVAAPGRSAYDLAKGVAKFQSDMTRNGMLYARALKSPYGRATVEIIDTTPAENYEGVVAVYRWDDDLFLQYPVNKEQIGFQPLITDEADYEGDECGVVVVAKSDEICKRALELIDVKWTVLPHILDPRNADEEGAPIVFESLNPDSNNGGAYAAGIYEIGNVVEGFAACDNILEFDYAWGNSNVWRPQPPVYLSYWEPDPWGTADYGDVLYINGIECVAGSGLNDFARKMLGASHDNIRATTPYLGGGYCNYNVKRGAYISIVLSKELGVPVRWPYNRRDEFDFNMAQNYLHARVGFSNDGLIDTVQLKQVYQAGVRAGLYNRLQAVPMAIAPGAQGLNILKCNNIYSKTVSVYTNGICVTSEPSLKEVDLQAVTIQRVAEALNMDPVDVLLKNVQTSSPSLQMCIEAGMEAFNWMEKYHVPGTKTLEDGRLHGVALRAACTPTNIGRKFNISLALEEDGKVYLPYTQAVLGRYQMEALQAVIAEEMGVKLEDVICYETPHYPNWNTGSYSDGAKSGAFAAKEAAVALKNKVLASYCGYIGLENPEDADIVDSMIVSKADPSVAMPLAGLGAHVAAWSDEISPHCGAVEETTAMSVDFCEVAVDPETGDVEVLEIVSAHDFGKILRESSAIGQVEQECFNVSSIATREELVFDENTGVLLNGNVIDYKVGTRMDVSPVTVAPVESRAGVGAYGANAVAHCHQNRCLILGAIANALGTWVTSSPATPDKVLRALGKIS